MFAESECCTVKQYFCISGHFVCSNIYLHSEDYLFSSGIFRIHLIGFFRIAFCGKLLKELWENIHKAYPHCERVMYKHEAFLNLEKHQMCHFKYSRSFSPFYLSSPFSHFFLSGEKHQWAAVNLVNDMYSAF